MWEALQVGGKTFPTGFAAQTAAATGETKRNVNLQVARATALGPDIKLVAGTSLDKGVELDALAFLPSTARVVRHHMVTREAAAVSISVQLNYPRFVIGAITT